MSSIALCKSRINIVSIPTYGILYSAQICCPVKDVMNTGIVGFEHTPIPAIEISGALKTVKSSIVYTV